MVPPEPSKAKPNWDELKETKPRGPTKVPAGRTNLLVAGSSVRMQPERLLVWLKTAVYVKGTQVTAFPMWPAGFGDQTNGAQSATSQMAYQYGHTVERLSTSSWPILPSIKVIGGATIPGPFDWAGVSDQYFAAVFLPRDPENAAMVLLRGPIEIPHGGA